MGKSSFLRAQLSTKQRRKIKYQKKALSPVYCELLNWWFCHWNQSGQFSWAKRKRTCIGVMNFNWPFLSRKESCTRVPYGTALPKVKARKLIKTVFFPILFLFPQILELPLNIFLSHPTLVSSENTTCSTFQVCPDSDICPPHPHVSLW